MKLTKEHIHMLFYIFSVQWRKEKNYNLFGSSVRLLQNFHKNLIFFLEIKNLFRADSKQQWEYKYTHRKFLFLKWWQTAEGFIGGGGQAWVFLRPGKKEKKSWLSFISNPMESTCKKKFGSGRWSNTGNKESIWKGREPSRAEYTGNKKESKMETIETAASI